MSEPHDRQVALPEQIVAVLDAIHVEVRGPADSYKVAARRETRHLEQVALLEQIVTGLDAIHGSLPDQDLPIRVREVREETEHLQTAMESEMWDVRREIDGLRGALLLLLWVIGGGFMGTWVLLVLHWLGWLPISAG